MRGTLFLFVQVCHPDHGSEETHCPPDAAAMATAGPVPMKPPVRPACFGTSRLQ